MNIDLHYGDGFLTVQVPDENISDIIWPWQEENNINNEEIVGNALSCQQKEGFLKVSDGKKVCVLLTDGTRDIQFEPVFRHLFPLFRKVSFIEFLICTGTHNSNTAGNEIIKQQIKQAAKGCGINNYNIHVHDFQKDKLINAGRTSFGTEVIYNEKADEADMFVALSDVKCHYFAGYSNSIKNFVPGICAYRTAEKNHSLALDDKSTYGHHPWHSDINRRNNPLANDQLEAMKLIVRGRCVYSFITISSSGKIQWAKFGMAEETCREAFNVSDERNTHTIKRVDRLIVSPGGLPHDIDLYIAQRALELTKTAVKDGGEILFISSCPNGVGEKQTLENFYNRLTAPIETILGSIEEEYKLFSHKPYKFAQLIKRMERIWMHSQIPDDIIKSMHLNPTDNPQQVVDNWLSKDNTVKITIVDGANKIALYTH